MRRGADQNEDVRRRVETRCDRRRPEANRERANREAEGAGGGRRQIRNAHGLVTAEVEEGFFEIFGGEVVTAEEKVGHATLEVSGGG